MLVAGLEGGASFPYFGQQSLPSPFPPFLPGLFAPARAASASVSCQDLSAKRAGVRCLFQSLLCLKCLAPSLAHGSYSVNICRMNWLKDFLPILVKILKEGDFLQDFQRRHNGSLYSGKEGRRSVYQQEGHLRLSISEVIPKGSMARGLRTNLSEPHLPCCRRGRVGSWATAP